MTAVDTFASVAASFGRQGSAADRQARGIMARHLDGAAATAKADALQRWQPHGRGESGAAGTIRARMATDGGPEGFLLADGAAFFQEAGTINHPPQPVLGPAAERQAGRMARDIAEPYGRLVR